MVFVPFADDDFFISSITEIARAMSLFFSPLFETSFTFSTSNLASRLHFLREHEWANARSNKRKTLIQI
jgi:hypothetical protein